MRIRCIRLYTTATVILSALLFSQAAGPYRLVKTDSMRATTDTVRVVSPMRAYQGFLFDIKPKWRSETGIFSGDTAAFRTFSDSAYSWRDKVNIFTAPNYFTARQYMTSLAVDTMVGRTDNFVRVADSFSVSGRTDLGGSVTGGRGQNYLIPNSAVSNFIHGYRDSIYSTSTSNSGQNYIWGNNNTIGRTNPSGTFGNWLWGQYLRAEGVGLWAIGADDTFEKKAIPLNGTIAFVNENIVHWWSNTLPSLYSSFDGYSSQTPRVKDSIRFTWRLTKYGSAVDTLAHAGYAFESQRNWIVTNGILGSEGLRIKRYFSVNDADDDAWHFNSYNSSGKPFAPIYVDSSHLIVSQGYVDADEFKLNGTTFLSTSSDIPLTYIDTTGTTGLRSKYVPYSGANAPVNLGAQTLTTTGATATGALTVTGAIAGSSTAHIMSVGNANGLRMSFVSPDASNASSRIYHREDGSSLFGFSTIYAGDTNPTLDGTAFTLPANTYYLIRHNNSATGTQVWNIDRGTGNMGYGTRAFSSTTKFQIANDLLPTIQSWINSRGTTVASLDSVGAGTFSGKLQSGGLTSAGTFGVSNTMDTVTYTSLSSGFTKNLTSTAGMYRLVYTIFCTTADAAAGSIQLTLSFNNGAAQTMTSAAVNLTSTANKDDDVFVFYVASGTPSISTAITGSAGTSKHSVHAIVERLK